MGMSQSYKTPTLATGCVKGSMATSHLFIGVQHYFFDGEFAKTSIIFGKKFKKIKQTSGLKQISLPNMFWKNQTYNVSNNQPFLPVKKFNGSKPSHLHPSISQLPKAVDGIQGGSKSLLKGLETCNNDLTPSNIIYTWILCVYTYICCL